MVFKDLFIVACLCLSSVSGFYVKHTPIVPTTTPTALISHQDIAVPEPTGGPGDKELRRRQTAQVTQRSVLEAPDNTCGYFGGNSAQPWGCTVGANCVFATATIDSPLNGTNSSQTLSSTRATGSILCCDVKTGCPAQPAPTACVDKGRYDYNKTCTGNCPHDELTLKCTSGIYLYCNTVTFSAPAISAFFCNYLSTYDALPAETTYSGQSNHSFTPTVMHFATTTNSPSSTIITASSTKVSAVATTAPAEPSETRNKKVIIGGVTGGVLGLALIAGLGVVLLRRLRRKQKEVVPVKGGKRKSVSFVDSPTPGSITGSGSSSKIAAQTMQPKST